MSEDGKATNNASMARSCSCIRLGPCLPCCLGMIPEIEPRITRFTLLDGGGRLGGLRRQLWALVLGGVQLHHRLAGRLLPAAAANDIEGAPGEECLVRLAARLHT